VKRAPILGLALAAILVTALVRVQGHGFGNGPTWNRDISRLVYDRCASCHREGGTAFALMTYADVQPRAVAIKDAVLSRRMPPWGAVKGFGDFRNDQGLSQEQIELVTDWVNGGMRKGNNPNMLPEPPKFDTSAPAETVPDTRLALRGALTLDRPIVLAGLLPDDVPDGASPQIVATLPDGRVEPLLWLYEYRNRYRHPFLFRRPLQLPAGTVIQGAASARIELLTK
jgi:mono/diheme cytochrome c family protein